MKASVRYAMARSDIHSNLQEKINTAVKLNNLALKHRLIKELNSSKREIAGKLGGVKYEKQENGKWLVYFIDGSKANF